MTVYVDDMMMRADVPNGSRVVRGIWCHMFADTREELDEMAVRIGMRLSWIQKPGTPREHYDVTKSRREAAIKAGAVVLPIRSPEWREFFAKKAAAAAR